MATGGGKTLAAIRAAERCTGLELIIIAVPRRNLVEQWERELRLRSRFPAPVLAYESASQWQERLFSKLRARASLSSSEPVVVVGTMASLSGQRFQSVIADAGVPEGSLLIVDEVHNVGAPSYRSILNSSIPWRLGLSATPARHFDEVGTASIYEYFQKLVYNYDLKRALADGILSPYKYEIYPAPLSEEEYEEYRALTQRIVSLRNQEAYDPLTFQSNNSLDGDSGDVEQLLFRRARILKKCSTKGQALRDILEARTLKRTLIYCADNEQLSAISPILKEKNIVHVRYTADTPKVQRQHALEKGKVPSILAIDRLDDEVDVPVVDMAVFRASSVNRRQLNQRACRNLRQFNPN